ncbi:hypothetical protein IFM89_012469 [Coptis chinensis]|uniref:Uncharacterized protein n=1 Tax=Coptis chinensis TaxID=261450 RepID=A0A835I1U4_9MAGN|nr:hypothetical protein IFM89_012469 [Coptis chinensis]
MINFHIQACAFRDSYEKFKKAGAEVVGISGDDPSPYKVLKNNKVGDKKNSFALSFSKRWKIQISRAFIMVL